jgi:hypothetical protein
VDGSTPDLYSDDGVKSSNGGLEGLQTGVFIRENAEFGGRACVVGVRMKTRKNAPVKKRQTMVRNTEGDTGRNVLLVWTEPSVALSLTKYPVKECVIPIVVHEREEEEDEEEEASKEMKF